MSDARSPGRAVSAALVCGVLFAVATGVATQVHTVRVRSPWRDDPDNAVLCFALVCVPALAVLLVARRVARRAMPGQEGAKGRDAQRQMRRAALALVGLVDVALAFEWAAMIVRAHRASWNALTVLLAVVAGVLTLTSGPVTAGLIRDGALHRRREPWRTDWLEDLAVLLSRVPGRREVDLTRTVAVIRRHAAAVFGLLSLAGAVVVVAALASGEGWTDPGLIAWTLAVETTANLCACMIVNAVAGIVARPASRYPRLEIAVAGGCVAVQLAVAFHTGLGRLVFGHDPGRVSALAALTAGAAVAGAAVTGAAAAAVGARPGRPRG